jgi:hypothetical protein
VGLWWKRAAFVLGLVAGGSAIWLKYEHGVHLRIAVAAMLGVLAGPFIVLFAFCCSGDLLRTNEKSKPLVDKLGMVTTRLIYAVIGLLVIVMGWWFLHDHFNKQ